MELNVERGPRGRFVASPPPGAERPPHPDTPVQVSLVGEQRPLGEWTPPAGNILMPPYATSADRRQDVLATQPHEELVRKAYLEGRFVTPALLAGGLPHPRGWPLLVRLAARLCGVALPTRLVEHDEDARDWRHG